MRVILHPEAEAEILRAQRYYSEVRPALGRRFYDELSGLLLRVGERPLAFKQCEPACNIDQVRGVALPQ